MKFASNLPSVHKAYEACEFMEVIPDVALGEMLVSTKQ